MLSFGVNYDSSNSRFGEGFSADHSNTGSSSAFAISSPPVMNNPTTSSSALFSPPAIHSNNPGSSNNMLSSPVNNSSSSPFISERKTSRLFDYASRPSSSSSFTSTGGGGGRRQMKPIHPQSSRRSQRPEDEDEDKQTEGDLAKLDHEVVMYHAMLDECSDRLCTGVLSGCHKSHTWNTWQAVRRDPRKVNYGSKLCSFYAADGHCAKGDMCGFAHSKTEVLYHPRVYKTQPCNRYSGSRYCGNKLCAYYHIFDDGSDDMRKVGPEASDNNNNNTTSSPTGSLVSEDNWLLDRGNSSKAIANSRTHSFLEASSHHTPQSPRFGSIGSALQRGYSSGVSQSASNFSLENNNNSHGLSTGSWRPTWKRGGLERSVSEMKVSDRNWDVPSKKNSHARSSFSSSTDNVDMAAYEAAVRHWSLEHLDSKMKNPSRKESQFGLNLLAWVPDFPLRELIKVLHDENWTVEQLRSYLSHTLVRALEERKIVISESGKFAGFNTGLMPPNASYAMIAVLTYSPVQQGTKFEWTLTHFKTPNEVLAAKFLPSAPPSVSYMDGRSDMWFDANKRILSFGEPLLARVIDRITEVRPEVVDFDVFTQMAILESAMKHAESNVLQNPSIAVPSFYRPKGQLYGSVQFLLPISFSDDQTKVDGALAVQERSTGYVACTVLTLQDAYAHARLIGRPTADWLTAVCVNSTSEGSSTKSSGEEKLYLDKMGDLQFFYHENSVPRLLAVPVDEKAGEKSIRNDILQFAKKNNISELSTRRVESSGKPVWELYMNHKEYMQILKTYGRMSSLESYCQNFYFVSTS